MLFYAGQTGLISLNIYYSRPTDDLVVFRQQVDDRDVANTVIAGKSKHQRKALPL